MSTRLYFLVPDVETASRIVDDLLRAHVPERHIHVVAREGTPLDELPRANMLQSTDLVTSIERGIAAGGATGLLAGLIAVSFPPAGLVLGGGAVLATTLAGAGFGAWAASLIGVSLPNSELESFERAIREGALLMLVDVAQTRARDIALLVRRHHPDVAITNVEPERRTP